MITSRRYRSRFHLALSVQVTNSVMLIKVPTLAVWILTLLLVNIIATKDKQTPKHISFLNFPKKRLTQNSPEIFWKRLFHKNESIRTVGLGYLNKTLHYNNDEADKITNNEELHGNIMKNINRKTLIDYNGPVIMSDFDSSNDQILANRVRVKRNGFMNDLIIPHQWNHSVNLIDPFSQNVWIKSHTINTFSENDKINNLLSKYKKLNIDPDHRSRSNIYSTAVNILHSRHKRGILSNSRKRKKRVKGSNGHSNHHIRTQVRNKKHNILKSSVKKANKKNKKSEVKMSIKPVNESRIEKRESENSSLNTIDYKNVGDLLNSKKDVSLTNGSNKRGGNTIVLPFVRTGKAELRVRIEKIITNKTSLTKPDNWVNHSTEIGFYSTTLPDYETVYEITESTITNLETTTHFDSTKQQERCNLTMEIVFKKLDGKSDLNTKTSDSENTLHTESYPVESNLSEDQNSENEIYDRVNKMSVESSEEDSKSRAKRNEQVASNCFLRSDNKNTIKGPKHTEREISVIDGKQKGTKYRKTRGNRAARSIEEIKELAEKLIVKVNELQMYVSNNKTAYTMNSCVEKADYGTTIKVPNIFLEKHVSSSKIAKNVDQHLAKNKQTSLAGRTSLVSSSGSRFPRGQSRISRKSQRKWGRWMDWSSCSVTCGKGRQIRWRHCFRDCDDAETEMEEKACQLPACPPGKFLGIF